MNAELPPWLSLPAKVRERVMIRFKELTKDWPPPNHTQEESMRDLQDLGKHRLIAFHDGNVEAAIEYAKTHDMPNLDLDPEHWREADKRVRRKLANLQSDPVEAARGVLLAQLIREELTGLN